MVTAAITMCISSYTRRLQLLIIMAMCPLLCQLKEVQPFLKIKYVCVSVCVHVLLCVFQYSFTSYSNMCLSSSYQSIPTTAPATNNKNGEIVPPLPTKRSSPAFEDVPPLPVKQDSSNRLLPKEKHITAHNNK